MPDSICLIPDCAKTAVKRGWCGMHYRRWQRHGDPLGSSPRPPLPLCSVDRCGRVHDSLGYCTAHYQRFRRYGDAGPAEVEERRKDGRCTVDGCDAHHYGHGFCTKHYQRWFKYGDPDTVLPGPWKGDAVGYGAVHRRLVTAMGPASEHPCAHCSGDAVDWAYDGRCPSEKSELVHGYPLAYSTDPDRYMPLCRACHSRLDNNYPKLHRERTS